MKRYAIAAISAALTVTAAHAQQVIKEDKAKCQMTVPADFRQQEIFGKKIAAAASPDRSVDAVVNLMDDTDWNMFNTLIWQVYTKEKDRPKIENTPKRMWFEVVTLGVEQGKTGWYVAVPGKAGACNAQINFRKGDKKAEAIARQIVDSIKSN